jgi:exosortase
MQRLPLPTLRILAASVLSVAVVWSHWQTEGELVRAWSHDPTYSHGFVVVVFAALLLWLRRDLLRAGASTPSAWGLLLLLVAESLHTLGSFYYLVWVERVSLLPALAGVGLLAGGKRVFRWAWLPITFLLFMVPLPGTVGAAMTMPLKRVATAGSTYLLQVLGFMAVADGNIILLQDHELGVIDACSGLRMLVVFFAVATMVALVVDRPFIVRALVVASAVPIALASNILRITLTGVLTETVGSELAHAVYHDLAGWLMMVFAAGLLWVELLILSGLIVVRPRRDAMPDVAEQRREPSESLATPARGACDGLAPVR